MVHVVINDLSPPKVFSCNEQEYKRFVISSTFHREYIAVAIDGSIGVNIMPGFTESVFTDVYMAVYSVSMAIIDEHGVRVVGFKYSKDRPLPLHPKFLVQLGFETAAERLTASSVLKRVIELYPSFKPDTLMRNDDTALQGDANIFDSPHGSTFIAADMTSIVPVFVYLDEQRYVKVNVPIGTTLGELQVILAKRGVDATFMYFKEESIISDFTRDDGLVVWRYYRNAYGTNLMVHSVRPQPPPKQRLSAVTQGRAGTCWFHSTMYLLLESPVFDDMLQLRANLKTLNCSLENTMENKDAEAVLQREEECVSKGLPACLKTAVAYEYNCFRLMKRLLKLDENEMSGGIPEILLLQILNSSINPDSKPHLLSTQTRSRSTRWNVIDGAFEPAMSQDAYASRIIISYDDDFIDELNYEMGNCDSSVVVIEINKHLDDQFDGIITEILQVTAVNWVLAGVFIACSHQDMPGHAMAAVPDVDERGSYKVHDSQSSTIESHTDLGSPLRLMCKRNGYIKDSDPEPTSVRMSFVMRAARTIRKHETPSPMPRRSLDDMYELDFRRKQPESSLKRSASASGIRFGGGGSRGVLAVVLSAVAVLGALFLGA